MGLIDRQLRVVWGEKRGEEEEAAVNKFALKFLVDQSASICEYRSVHFCYVETCIESGLVDGFIYSL